MDSIDVTEWYTQANSWRLILIFEVSGFPEFLLFTFIAISCQILKQNIKPLSYNKSDL